MIKTNDTEQNNTKLCLAKTRSGAPCQKHPIAGRTRCRLHGGLSTGPKTPEGKAACLAAHWKHGRRSKAYSAARKQIWADLREVERKMRKEGIIWGQFHEGLVGCFVDNPILLVISSDPLSQQKYQHLPRPLKLSIDLCITHSYKLRRKWITQTLTAMPMSWY